MNLNSKKNIFYKNYVQPSKVSFTALFDYILMSFQSSDWDFAYFNVIKYTLLLVFTLQILKDTYFVFK